MRGRYNYQLRSNSLCLHGSADFHRSQARKPRPRSRHRAEGSFGAASCLASSSAISCARASARAIASLLKGGNRLKRISDTRTLCRLRHCSPMIQENIAPGTTRGLSSVISRRENSASSSGPPPDTSTSRAVNISPSGSIAITEPSNSCSMSNLAITGGSCRGGSKMNISSLAIEISRCKVWLSTSTFAELRSCASHFAWNESTGLNRTKIWSISSGRS